MYKSSPSHRGAENSRVRVQVIVRQNSQVRVRVQVIVRENSRVQVRVASSVRESESSHESRKSTLESDSSPSPGLEYSISGIYIHGRKVRERHP